MPLQDVCRLLPVLADFCTAFSPNPLVVGISSLGIIELLGCLGWKSSLRPLSPAVNPALPRPSPNHVPKCLISTSVQHLQGVQSISAPSPRQGLVFNSEDFSQPTPSLLQNFQASRCNPSLTEGQRTHFITLVSATFWGAEGSDAPSVLSQEQPQPRFQHCTFSLLSSTSPSQASPFPLCGGWGWRWREIVSGEG